MQADPGLRQPGEQGIGCLPISRPERKFYVLALGRSAEKRGKRLYAMDLMHAVRIGQRRVQQAGAITWTNEAGGGTRTQQENKRVRINACSLHLDGQIELLLLHLSQEADGGAGLKKLVSDTREARKGQNAINVWRTGRNLLQQRQ